MSEEIETGVSHIAYFRTDGGSSKLYTQEYVDDLQKQLQQKDNIIKKLNDYLQSDTFCNIFHCCEERNKVIKEIKQVLDKENK